MSPKSSRPINPWINFLHVFAKQNRNRQSSQSPSNPPSNFIQRASRAWRQLGAAERKEFVHIDRKPRLIANNKLPKTGHKYVFKSRTKELNSVLNKLRKLNLDSRRNESHLVHVNAIQEDIRRWQEGVLDSLCLKNSPLKRVKIYKFILHSFLLSVFDIRTTQFLYNM